MHEGTNGKLDFGQFFPKTTQFSASSKGQTQPVPLLNFSALIQAIPADWLDRSMFLSVRISRAQKLGIIGWT